MKNYDTRLTALEQKARARMLRESKAFLHGLNDVALAALLSKVSPLDCEIACLIMAVSEAELMHAASETGQPGRGN